jgi:hypothetical protein
LTQTSLLHLVFAFLTLSEVLALSEYSEVFEGRRGEEREGGRE